MSPCAIAISDEALFDYWDGALPPDEEAALEDHLFGCAACAGKAGSARALVQALRTRIPPFVTRAALEHLLGSGVRIRQTSIQPGERVVVEVGTDVDILVHRFQIDTRGLERVDCHVESAAGEPLISFADASFDRERGEINIVCQRHYVARFPPDARFRLESVEASGRRELATYGVMHVLTD